MSEPGSVRVAVVTGGTRGIGRAVVEALLGEGWRVHLCGRTAESAARAERELAGRFGGAVRGRGVDVARQEEVDAYAAWVLGEEAGRVDCLVNNAGWGVFAPVDEIAPEDWRGILDTNLSGAFYCTRAFAPAMKRRGGGWIFNIASLAGKNPFAGGAAYNASKFGMVGFSEASMLDLRPHGIRVAAILPGSVDTSFGMRQGRSGASWMLAPEDIARIVLDLLAFPDRALPSLVEIRPSRPPAH